MITNYGMISIQYIMVSLVLWFECETEDQEFTGSHPTQRTGNSHLYQIILIISNFSMRKAGE